MDRSMWLGLMPETTLIPTHKGGSYELNVQRRINDASEQVKYLAADSLQSYVISLYRTAAFGSSDSSQASCRAFASRLLAQVHTIETVQLLLGHAELDHVAPHLDVRKRELREVMADVGDHRGKLPRLS